MLDVSSKTRGEKGPIGERGADVRDRRVHGVRYFSVCWEYAECCWGDVDLGLNARELLPNESAATLERRNIVCLSLLVLHPTVYI